MGKSPLSGHFFEAVGWLFILYSLYFMCWNFFGCLKLPPSPFFPQVLAFIATHLELITCSVARRGLIISFLAFQGGWVIFWPLKIIRLVVILESCSFWFT